ncbi:outer membrane protein [Mycolicibacterium chitae]|uniref:Mce associated membrane protein n=1 Tax=Mycolicibacterium chitae TaxID=1792 RepID=A0A448I9Z5_MYCCI|nr:hypothetical protein [Mycolicibacterium chitae]MCV7105067.1 hypothetical protein [Mycolicibacterium chitae]BBZ05653.1 outer membrane protein [Mycolicibacterium chitae]VEG49264.1 Mce associated membrane protein [Mycolicibacterium chitae]
MTVTATEKNAGVIDEVADADSTAVGTTDDGPRPDPAAARGPGSARWLRVCAFIVLPALVLLSGLGAGYAKWLGGSAERNPSASIAAVQAATDGTIAMLSYQHDTVEQQLGAVGDRLTGDFKDGYAALVNDVVIPGSKQQKISAEVTIPAVAPVTVSDTHAAVLLFVNQATTIGDDAPTSTTSSVRVGLDKVDGKWLISEFQPI